MLINKWHESSERDWKLEQGPATTMKNMINVQNFCVFKIVFYVMLNIMSSLLGSQQLLWFRVSKQSLITEAQCQHTGSYLQIIYNNNNVCGCVHRIFFDVLSDQGFRRTQTCYTSAVPLPPVCVSVCVRFTEPQSESEIAAASWWLCVFPGDDSGKQLHPINPSERER